MNKLLIVVLAAMLGACSAVSVDPGIEAVLVDKPLIFGSGGIQKDTVKTGREYTWLSTSPILVDMRPQQADIVFDDLMTKDGVPLDFGAAFRFKISSAYEFVEKFGNDTNWFGRNLEQAFRNACRDSVKKRGMNEMAIDATASSQVDSEVSDAMMKAVAAENIPIVVLGVTLGKANPPDSIKHQRIDTATQEQRIQTEKQRALAENQRLEAERARANADNAYRLAMNLSPDQFLQLESIKAMEKVCGDKNCQIITTGALPTFGIK